jgi:Heterokaryon incompatibility protein (HET)
MDDSTSSANSLHTFVEWYKTCRTGHASCKKALGQMRFVPSRLVDVGSTDYSPWRILTSEDLASKQPYDMEYMTLSHCWGNASFLTLDSQNLARLREGMPSSMLPLTFEEALYVARQLGCRLLWIDSLCILQDSLEDWRRESLQMSEIYSNAVCNIAATASYDPDNGLFRDRDPHLIAPCIVWATWKGEKSSQFVITDSGGFMDQVVNAPLNQRAWVFQERVLSTRLLQFGNEQIFWQCRQLDACEGQPRGTAYGLGVGRPTFRSEESSLRHCVRMVMASSETAEFVDDFFQIWQYIVAKYTEAELTQPSDKLIALSGIADILRKAYKDEYLAGIWRSHLPAALLWHRITDYNFRAAFSELFSKQRQMARAPSWSWASLEGIILFGDWWRFPHQRHLLKPISSVLAAEVSEDVNAASKSFPQGFIKLEAFVLHGIYFQPTDAIPPGKFVSEPTEFPVYVVEDTPIEIPSLSLYCALISRRFATVKGETYCHFEGLLLQPEDTQDGAFTRFGYCIVEQPCSAERFEAMTTPADISELLKNFERRDITLL